MSRISLSNTGDWKLEFDDQDIRGFKALDADGTAVGTVDTMVVNTDEERVDAIVLEDGTEYPAADISIGDGVVYLTTVQADSAGAEVNESVRVYSDSGQVVRREQVSDGDYDAHVDAFRAHHGSSYADTSFDDYDPAYRFGFDTAHDEAYRNRSFIDAEDDIRTGYGSSYADRDFDADRDAIRYGYTRAQHPTR